MTNSKNNTFAIVAYFWWIGFLIALFKNQSEKNAFTSFHLRQILGLLLVNTGASVIYKYLGDTIGTLLILGTFVLWVIGLLSAIRGEAKPVPLIGESFQNWFKNLY